MNYVSQFALSALVAMTATCLSFVSRAEEIELVADEVAKIESLALPGGTVETAEPIYRLTPRPQPNPQEVRARFKGTVDGVAWWLNMWADTKLQPAIKASVEETAKAQVGLMKWTGHGVLLRLEVVRRHDKETPLEAVGILGESAFVIGSGQTPEDAWIEFQSRAGIWRPGVPEGWQLDQVMSTYTWVERDKNGELTYRNVPQGIVTDLESKIIYNWGQYYTSHLNTKRNNRRLWLTVAENAKASINDRVAKDSIDRSFRLVDEFRKRVADIEERLQKALQAEKDGANAARIIRTLKGILTVAELVDKAALLMGEKSRQVLRRGEC